MKRTNLILKRSAAQKNINFQIKLYMHIFEKLKSLHQPAPINRKRPTLEIITEVEDKLEIKLPATYKKFQLEYSDINLPPFEMFTLLKDGGELDFVKNTNDARAYYQLP